MYRHEFKGKFKEAVRSLWRRTGEGRWLLAVSGGADSVALLLACRLASIPIQAVHCNFNLRDSESLRDRDFVVELCRRLEVTLHVEEFNVEECALKGESTEMTCRRIRYALFEELLSARGCSKVAVAHNSDDNAETLFLNLLRVSGATGLKGMEPVARNIVRPLLCFSRKEILSFLEECGQDFITDSTNLESDYRRNFIRNDVFPLLEERWPGMRRAIMRSQDILRREHLIVEHFISTALAPFSDFLPWDVVRGFPDPESLMWRFVEGFGGTPALAAEIARHAFSVYPGKRWLAPSGTIFRSLNKGLRVIPPPTP